MIKMWFKKREFIEWNEYKSKIEFMDIFFWQQSVRKANMES